MENTVAQLFDPEGGYELDVEIGKRIVGEKVGFKAFIYGSPEHMVHRNSWKDDPVCWKSISRV